ncbi:MAG: prepilin-type N-terminal cleavage/methylation domain-containing protein [Planctomycetota bacterium]|jgi:prepilin-type N-terminal cleavage/methylation domain-containing protein
MRARGFTLIELMIVVAVIAIIAAVAIPGLLRSRMSANEASTIGTLKSLATGQQAFRNSNAIDLNSDGQGEYGYLSELSGTGNCRSNNTGTTNGSAFTSSPYVPRILGVMNGNNESEKAGYLYICYLPTSPTAGTFLYPGTVDIGLATQNHVCYAFPAISGKSGLRVFAVDHAVNIFGFSNRQATYSGTGNPPPWNAVFGDTDGQGGVTWADAPDQGGPGQTGQPNDVWTVVGGS